MRYSTGFPTYASTPTLNRLATLDFTSVERRPSQSYSDRRSTNHGRTSEVPAARTDAPRSGTCPPIPRNGWRGRVSLEWSSDSAVDHDRQEDGSASNHS